MMSGCWFTGYAHVDLHRDIVLTASSARNMLTQLNAYNGDVLARFVA